MKTKWINSSNQLYTDKAWFLPDFLTFWTGVENVDTLSVAGLLKFPCVSLITPSLWSLTASEFTATSASSSICIDSASAEPIDSI